MRDHQLLTYVGSLEPLEFTVSEALQAQYLEALQDHHLRYVVGQRGLQPLVHPGILLSYSNATRSPSFSGPNTQWLHFRERTQFCAPARLHDRLSAQWDIEAHEQWLGRTLSCASCVVSRDDGVAVLRRVMWGFRSSPQRPVPSQAPAAVSAAVPSTAAPDRGPRPLDPLAWTIDGRRKSLTSERMRLFSGGRQQNLHTSDQVARRAGLPGALASAAQGMGYLCEFMIDNLGEDWLRGGRWSLTFRRPVFAGDVVSASGEVRSIAPGGDAPCCTIDVRLVNQKGVTTAQGTATGLLKEGLLPVVR